MKTSKLTNHALVAIAVAICAVVSQAQAAPIVSVNLSTSNVQLGSGLGVDINVSGLTGALGGFSFDLDYDGTRFAFSSFLADPDTKMGTALIPAGNFSGGNLGNSVNFVVLAGCLPGPQPLTCVPEATLAGLQGTGFTMGRVGLTATSLGFASLNLRNVFLSDFAGSSIRDVTARGARVCVSSDGLTPCANVIPEPTTPLLVMAALGALALIRKRQSA